MIYFFIQSNQPFSAPAHWFVAFLARHWQISIEILSEDKEVERGTKFKITTQDASFPLAFDFYKKIENLDFQNLRFSEQEMGILTTQGAIDYMATVVYWVNCLQEYDRPETDFDAFGRFKYVASYQKRQNCVTQNTVGSLIEAFRLYLKLPVFPSKKTQIWLTHDIDSLYGSWKHDTKWLLKNRQFGAAISLIINTLKGKRPWFNIGKMLEIHARFSVVSTYFWLVKKGRSADGIKNADYALSDKKIVQALESIHQQGSELGLHKSTIHSSFEAEFSALPSFSKPINRYHFLRFRLPQAWHTLEDAGVTLDSSLGFAEHYGFRNGYAQPFQPYNFAEKKSFNLVVVPLNIMDGSFENYMKMPKHEIWPTIEQFLSQNSENAHLTFLWHNTEFSEYAFAEYLELYKKLLQKIQEMGLKTGTSDEILREFQTF
jgi:hypothetical protein